MLREAATDSEVYRYIFGPLQNWYGSRTFELLLSKVFDGQEEQECYGFRGVPVHFWSATKLVRFKSI